MTNPYLINVGDIFPNIINIILDIYEQKDFWDKNPKFKDVGNRIFGYAIMGQEFPTGIAPDEQIQDIAQRIRENFKEFNIITIKVKVIRNRTHIINVCAIFFSNNALILGRIGLTANTYVSVCSYGLEVPRNGTKCISHLNLPMSLLIYCPPTLVPSTRNIHYIAEHTCRAYNLPVWG